MFSILLEALIRLMDVLSELFMLLLMGLAVFVIWGWVGLLLYKLLGN